MRYLFLILLLFITSGCRTFNDTQAIIVKDLMSKSYIAGYREGRTDGVDLGESFGYIKGIKDCSDNIMKER